MKKIYKMFNLFKKHKFTFIILGLMLIFLSVAVYSNRIGIIYYLSRFLGLNHQTDNKVEKEEDIKPLAFTFKNWYVEVDLDDINNPYKNVNLDNLIISGGVGKYKISYEIKKDVHPNKMVYTVMDEADNTISKSQIITYTVSRTSRNKAMEVFYSIVKKYNYSVMNSNETYKNGNYNKFVNNNKIDRIITLLSQRLEVNTVGSDGTPTNNYCDYNILADYYNCMLNGNSIKYENYTELQKPMQDLIEEYNDIMTKYNQAGYSYEYFIAQVKD